MSYLIIPAAGGTSHRRVDLAAIAELFVEEEPVIEAPPSKLSRFKAAFRAVVAPCQETLGLLRDEARARKMQGRQTEPRIARAYGI
jgi:hypothetical protein